MLTVQAAIEKRRTIRKFKPDPVPQELIWQLLEAARLAPSAGNRHPWRFQVVTDLALKKRICEEAAFGQQPVQQAPVIIVCGGELFCWVKGHPIFQTTSAELYSTVNTLNLPVRGADSENWDDIKVWIPEARLNTGIAIEHMILMATALGLGSCWVGRIRHEELGQILGWPRHIVPVAILAIGYPNETPSPIKRLSLEQILITGPTA